MQQKNFRLAKFQVVQRKSRVVTYMSHVEVFMSRIKLNHMINALLESRSRDQGNLRTANIKNQEQRSSIENLEPDHKCFNRRHESDSSLQLLEQVASILNLWFQIIGKPVRFLQVLCYGQ